MDRRNSNGGSSDLSQNEDDWQKLGENGLIIIFQIYFTFSKKYNFIDYQHSHL